MAEFYKILKKTRIQQGIELEEIQNRTKINISFLHALENGEFELLPEPYIRLFLKAYGNEVGLNTEELLELFEQASQSPPPKSKGKEKAESKKNIAKKIVNEGNIISPPITPKKSREKIIKSVLLLSLWIFGLYIIHKITNNTEKQSQTETELTADEFIEKLNTQYHEVNKEEHQIFFNSPYSLTIKTVSRLLILTLDDTNNFSKITLNSGENKIFRVDSELNLTLDHTQNVVLAIHGDSNEILLEKFQNYHEPIKISISLNPPVYSIKQYSLKNKSY